MEGCSIWDKIKCGSKFAACASICGSGAPAECTMCLGGVNGGCMDCLGVRVGIATAAPNQEQSELIKQNTIIVEDTGSILTTVFTGRNE